MTCDAARATHLDVYTNDERNREMQLSQVHEYLTISEIHYSLARARHFIPYLYAGGQNVNELPHFRTKLTLEIHLNQFHCK